MDYRDEYKEVHPKEFIDVMVIANIIPPERERRLLGHAIEFRAIPKSDFPEHLEVALPKVGNNNIETNRSYLNKRDGEGENNDSFNLFLSQATKFKEEIKNIDKNIKRLKGEPTRKNPYIWFWPNSWQRFVFRTMTPVWEQLHYTYFASIIPDC